MRAAHETPRKPRIGGTAPDLDAGAIGATLRDDRARVAGRRRARRVSVRRLRSAARAGIHPGWFAGTSIGAINAAILAGNAPERRIERLHEFWNTICEPAGRSRGRPPRQCAMRSRGCRRTDALSAWLGALSAFGALAQGQRGFFMPRALPPFAQAPGSAAATSFYDTAPLKATLEQLVDFDRINGAACA